MRKILGISLWILLGAVILMPMIESTQASIEQFTWLPPYVYKGYDYMFYQTNIIGYEEGATALLQVPVYNDWWTGTSINVSAVKIEFDWEINYTSAEASKANPVQIQPYQRYTFTINFTVPSTTVASNFLAHTYKIYVEHVNATTGPKQIVGTWEVNWDWWWPAYRFAVFSADQADAFDLFYEYQAYYNSYRPYYFTNIEARLLASQAGIEASTGQLYYMRGDFVGAKAQFETALNLYDQALSAEKEWGMTYQEAQLNVTQVQANAALKQADAAMIEANATKTQADAALTEANAALKQADAAMIEANAAMTNAYGWMTIGIGWTLIGIGVIIYGLRKPKT